MAGGKVYLVGAGPGAIAHLTLRGYQLLTRADVLVHDALIGDDLLAQVPPHCRRVAVGKRGGQSSTPQPSINQLLVDTCSHGHQVVRLKGGDPFIFGRSGAEIQALKAAGCDFEVVPGISSALAAPLLAGIPLTDPVFSRSFLVTSGHDPMALNWHLMAEVETLVILMGGRQLTTILHKLQQAGRSPRTPIAVIHQASQPQQQVWTGTLATIAEQLIGKNLSPAMLVIGEVVHLRDYLSPDQDSGSLDDGRIPMLPTMTDPLPLDLPLAGKTILITRAATQAHEFCQHLRAYGAHVLEMPTLEIGPPSSWEALDESIQALVAGQFDWLILTSVNGVQSFLDRLAAQGQDVRALAGVKVAVVGQKTAAFLAQRGIQPDFVPPDFVADSLADHFPGGKDLSGLRLLFPRVESGGRDLLIQTLGERGAKVVAVPAYESRCPRGIAPDVLAALQRHQVHMVTFASSKTVKNFGALLQQALGTSWCQTLSEVTIAAIGPQTAATCRNLLGRVEVEAQEYTLPGLTTAILHWAKTT